VPESQQSDAGRAGTVGTAKTDEGERLVVELFKLVVVKAGCNAGGYLRRENEVNCAKEVRWRGRIIKINARKGVR